MSLSSDTGSSSSEGSGRVGTESIPSVTEKSVIFV